MAIFSQYEGLSPEARDNTPIHIPSGIPGEPDTAGTATVGDRTMPFPIQQDTASEQQGWVKRMNDYDRVKRETEKAEQDAAYLKNLMMHQRTAASARQVEVAMQFQAMQNFERDRRTALAAGLSEQQASAQAFARNPGIFPRNGANAFANATAGPLGPASVVTDPESGKRIGLRIPGGPRTATFRLDTQPPKPGSLSAVDKERIKDLNRQEIELRKKLPTTPPKANYFGGQAKVDAYSALTNSIGGVRAKRDRILDGTNSPEAKPIRVRKKSDGPKGAVFLYPGNASDVNLEKYDILPPLP